MTTLKLYNQKQLRNILVHYKVDKISDDLFNRSWDLEEWLNWKGNPTSFFKAENF
ncbi:MAG: hypothetical protein AB4041_00700 [Microcystaceae cyanobacterium]